MQHDKSKEAVNLFDEKNPNGFYNFDDSTQLNGQFLFPQETEHTPTTDPYRPPYQQSAGDPAGLGGSFRQPGQQIADGVSYPLPSRPDFTGESAPYSQSYNPPSPQLPSQNSYGASHYYGGQDPRAGWQQPNYYTYSTPTPDPVPKTEKIPGKKKKAPRVIASVMALLLASGATGGGAAYWVMNNYSPETTAVPVASSPVTTAVPTASDSSGGVTEVVKKAAATVVEIRTETTAQNPFSMQYVEEQAGSGVIYTQDGYVVTNNHVISGVDTILVSTQDGVEYTAALIGTDSRTDLAVLKIEATGLQSVTLADSDALEVGQLAVAIGNPLGELGGTVTSGIISAKGREITIGSETMHLLQTSAAVNPGNSGGGLFDQNGNLVGVVNAKSAGSNIEGLAFAIPSNIVKEVVNEIMENGYVTGRVELGISVVDIADRNTAAMYKVNETGVYVASVNRNNGLEAGDLILSIDGTDILTSTDVRSKLNEYTVGDSVAVTVSRKGKNVTVEVILAEQIPESVRKATVA